MGLQPGEVLTEGALELGRVCEESVVRGMVAETLPQALDDVELRAVAGEAVELHVRHARQGLLNPRPPVPRRPVDGQHDLREERLGIDAPDVQQVAREILLHPTGFAVGRFAPRRRVALDHAPHQLACDEFTAAKA